MHTTQTKAEFWQEHLDQWRRSGQSQKTYCEQHELKHHVFIYWRRKLNAGQTPSEAGFVPVALNAIETKALTITLPNGIRIDGVNSTEQLRALVQCLT